MLEASERDRLKERKEKLSAIQSMIRLTKDKGELEEELDERNQKEFYEGGDNVSQFFLKFCYNT